MLESSTRAMTSRGSTKPPQPPSVNPPLMLPKDRLINSARRTGSNLWDCRSSADSASLCSIGQQPKEITSLKLQRPSSSTSQATAALNAEMRRLLSTAPPHEPSGLLSIGSRTLADELGDLGKVDGVKTTPRKPRTGAAPPGRRKQPREERQQPSKVPLLDLMGEAVDSDDHHRASLPPQVDGEDASMHRNHTRRHDDVDDVVSRLSRPKMQLEVASSLPHIPLAELAPTHHAGSPRAWAHRDEIENHLRSDARLGYGRRVVPRALVQQRMSSLLRIYRENADGAMEMLTERIRASQSERPTHSPQLQDRVKEAVMEASTRYLAEHKTAREVPYAVIHNAKKEVESTAESVLKHRTSPEMWKERNERRMRDQRMRLEQVAKEKREAVLQSTLRHEMLVLAAEAQREEEQRLETQRTWLVWSAAAAMQLRMTTRLLQFRVFQSLVNHDAVFRRAWYVWVTPALEHAQARHRLRMLGRWRFVLCAARLLAFRNVRKRKIAAVIMLLRTQLASQRFIESVHRFKKHVQIIQRCIRRFIAMHRGRVALLLLQWELVEGDMRHPNFSPVLGRVVTNESGGLTSSPSFIGAPQQGAASPATATLSQPSPPPRGSSGRVGKGTANHGKPIAGALSPSGPKAEEAMAQDLCTKDKIEHTTPIPFDVRWSVVRRLMTTHRRHFFQVDQPGLAKLDEEEYQRALAAFYHLPPRKQIPQNQPKKPKPRSLPLFVRRSVMLHTIQWYLEVFRALLQRSKYLIAKDAVRSGGGGATEYVNKREIIVTQRLNALDDAAKAEFERRCGVAIPRADGKHCSHVLAAVEDRNEAMYLSLSNLARVRGTGGSGGSGHATPSLFSSSHPHSPSHSTQHGAISHASFTQEVISLEATEVVQRNPFYASSPGFMKLAKHIEAVLLRVAESCQPTHVPAAAPQDEGKSTSRGGNRTNNAKHR